MEAAPTYKQCRHRSWVLIFYIDAPQHRYNVCMHTPTNTLHTLTTAATILSTHKAPTTVTLHHIHTTLEVIIDYNSQLQHTTYSPLQQDLRTMATNSASAETLHHLYINLHPALHHPYLKLSSKIPSSSAEIAFTTATHTPAGKQHDMHPPHKEYTKSASTTFHPHKANQLISKQTSIQIPHLPNTHTQDTRQTMQRHKFHKLTCPTVSPKPSASFCNQYIRAPLPTHTPIASTPTPALLIHTHPRCTHTLPLSQPTPQNLISQLAAPCLPHT